ncbi:MAG: TonB-dependent receptor [Bacteroidales bacterium]|nr:TonB-dependent receptor [Bacteroidales bacterium]
MKKIRFTLSVLFLLCFSISMIAQAKVTLQGEVVDKDNQPIIGASIVEKGTTNGTVTDLDGKFIINVHSTKSTLSIRYIGYENLEIAASNSGALRRVKMQESSIALNEAVVIGYGVVKKTDATGSVTAIKPDKLNKGVTTNAQDMITGKIAGVNITSNGGAPGAGATIRIRGGSSLSASNDPLIVIDGLAMDNDGIKGVSNPLSTINPNDIESFTVLKDASATAIYGSRASNGVIIITTKKGEKGARARVTYDGNASISSVKKTLDVLSGDEFRTLANTLYADKPDITSKLGTANTDWQKQIYQDALSHDHNINIMGGLKNMPYRISVGYTNQDGIVKTSNFERYTGAFNINPSLLDDHLKINVNAKAMLVKSRYADGGVVGASAAMDPTQPITSTDPMFTPYGGYFQWRGYTGSVLSTANPVATLNQKSDIADANDVIGSAEFDYKFHNIPELRAHLNVGMDASYGIQKLHIDSISPGDFPYGRKGWDKTTKTNTSLNYYMQYIKEFEKSKFDVMAGYEWQKFHREGSSEYQGLVQNIVDPKTAELVGYNHIKNVWKTENLLVSFFGRVNFSFNNKYLFTATLRDDGSSRFSKENRWGLFPAGAFAWKINEESFMKEMQNLSDLKLRLGYGVTGQQNIGVGDYSYIPAYAINKDGAYYPFGSEYLTTFRPNKYNKKLKWEQTTTYNAGLDFGFFKSRITGAVDYYFRETTDLLNEVVVAAGSNFSNILISNIGSLQNKGVELSISTKAITSKDFNWDIDYNVTYNSNKITKLIAGTKANYLVPTGGISSGTGNNVQAHTVGQPANSFYVYQQTYDQATGKPIDGVFVDRNKDGVINDDDRYFFHKPSADVTMGLSSKIVYKNFDLGIAMRASFGNFVYNDVDARSSNVGVAGVWSTSGFFSNKPSSALVTNFAGGTNNYFSDYYIQDASFLRCDNITLGYSFKNLFKVISSGRIYATVQNPFVVTKYKGLDPEIFGGIDNSIYPRPMVSLVGLNLSF